MTVDGVRQTAYPFVLAYKAQVERAKWPVPSQHEVEENREVMKTNTNEIEKKKVDAMLKELNLRLYGARREIRFSVHEKTKKMILRIVDLDNGKTVHEIPSEKSLEYLAKIMEETKAASEKWL
ncbi:MAG: flagellar protein FlaG [Clostridiales bacterium]|nr:flagellar protein FlaG [Clostridiales bacterium]MDR2749492.1 flagellar protein FlaG [Clostridiales bacterium]